ncbi:cell division cycle protein 48 [Haloarcula marismortui ATCC 43049]|uniref:AAA family ATPase n=1 Tax=Haloarcula marismortui (strain ATCC 43049 / DSM 3752 / JCM 8966 / VKM B-1809) TaxID=272569 RepID=Q5V0R7_HALMA|nr:AAA family ATPase [Haloarcula marismortui]AAV46886.1 cell division cycle protein 48 [Haloarcula marismortui ATCC 43049]QCP91592.1 AAA family ATPase [Haloarcula marismortui ATCC 43049]
MVQNLELTISVDEANESIAVPTTVGTRLGLGGNGAVLIRKQRGQVQAATVRQADSVPAETARVGPQTAETLGLRDGDRVTVEAADPAVATHISVAPVPQLSIRGGEGLVRDAVGDRPLLDGDTITVSLFDGSLTVPVRVVSTQPAGPVTLVDDTVIEITDGPAPRRSNSGLDPLAETAVGGYADTVATLETAVSTALLASDDVPGSVRNRAGVLLVGAHGVGKTHLLQHVAWLVNATIHSVDAGRLLSLDQDGARAYLDDVARAAQGSERGIVHIDGLDTVSADGGDKTRLLLRQWLDDISTLDGVAAVGEATSEDDVPVDIVQATRLSRTVTVPEPSRRDRAEILKTVATGAMVSAEADLKATGEQAFGYVAADIVALWLHAVEAAVARDGAGGDPVVVSAADLEAARDAVEPSGIRGTVPEIPSTSFSDIGGLDGPKRELIRAVNWPLTKPDLFDSLDIDPPAGVLLYGPPGTGKTMLARAVASTSDANFIPVNGPELMNKYVGESERAVRRVFDQARSNAPSIVFFDEIDALGTTRSDDNDSGASARTVSQLLTELDGIEGREGVTVIATTNRRDRLDDALLRTGRFDRIVEVSLPDAADRAEIFDTHIGDRITGQVDLEAFAARTAGYSGSDIAAVVREAGLLAIEEHLRAQGDSDRSRKPVSLRESHLEKALQSVESSGADQAGETGHRS